MKKKIIPLFLMILSGCATAPSATPVASAYPPSPATPQGTPPVLESISIRHQMERYPVVYPEFHFHAIDGNVNAIHREILSTNSPTPLNFVSDARIDISAEKQRSGAVYVGGWHCGPEKYEVQLRAVLIDSTGNRSNPLEYHIDCSGL